ncbi:MAG TPA: hypothetical protein EYM84_08070 [Flavobacteriales bacterium]|nr:hypothetical protein [Flavobacteriales bacterium]
MIDVLDSLKYLEKIELKTAVVLLRSDGIICIRVRDDAEVELEDSLETFEAVKKLGKGVKMPVLVLTGEGGTVSEESKRFSASKQAGEPTLAEAIVVRNFAHKLLVNFLIKFYRPGRPMKMFTSNGEAVEWLKSFQII